MRITERSGVSRSLEDYPELLNDAFAMASPTLLKDVGGRLIHFKRLVAIISATQTMSFAPIGTPIM